jgi:hypothetical protein
MAASGEGVFKFLRGGYGCGKTFMARLALLDAQARVRDQLRGGLDNDLTSTVRRRLPQGGVELGTAAAPAARWATCSIAGSGGWRAR